MPYMIKPEVTDEQLRDLGFVYFSPMWPLYKPNPTPFFKDEAILISPYRQVQIICSYNTPNEQNLKFLFEKGYVEKVPWK